MFCKYDNVFFFSWLFKDKKEQKNTTHHPIFNRTAKHIYLVFSWIKARVLYYANNWIYTTNHKRIAVNYFWFVILSGIFGMVLATVIRLELAYPGVGIFAGDSLQYLSLATAHGVIMVFFMIIPLISGAFANFLLPTQLGVHDVAFPRLNSAAFWFLPGGLMMLGQLICLDRRYQRMNCFNIREAQALLKSRFFVDLINSQDSHKLLDKTMIGLRFKTNDASNVLTQGRLTAFYGPNSLLKNRIFNVKENSTPSSSLRPESFNYTLISMFSNSNFVWLFCTKSFTATIKFLLPSVQMLTMPDVSLVKLFFDINYVIIVAIDFFYYTYEQLLIHYFIFDTYLSAIRLARKLWWQNVCRKITRTYIYKHWPFQQNTDHIKSLLLVDLYDTDLDVPYVDKNAKPKTVDNGYIINDSTSIFDFSFYTCMFNDYVTQTRSSFYTFFKNLLSEIEYLYSINVKNWNYFTLIFTQFHKDPLDFFYFELNKINQLLNEHNSYLVASKLIYRSFIDYWMSCATVVRTSLSLVFNAPFAYKTLHSLKIAHRTYSDFLSTWYFPVILNSDELQVIGLSTLLSHYSAKNNNLLTDITTFFTINPTFSDQFLRTIFLLKGVNLSVLSDKIQPKISDYYTLMDLGLVLNFINKSLLHQLLNCARFFNLYSFNNTSDTYYTLSSAAVLSQDSNLNSLTNNKETLNQGRNLRFNSPVFAYDYKTGNYFPKYDQENLNHLLSTFAKLTGGVRTPTWFLSLAAHDTFVLNMRTFFDAGLEHSKKSKFFINQSFSNRFVPSHFFYNFFTTLGLSKPKTPFYWTPFSSLTEKFEVMFTGTSAQERMYSNWRQLKFTREAWRCKLLIARHQKSLFRRYVRETGLFWSIERNARDLLPGWAMITPFSSRSRFTAIGKVDIGVSAILLVLISSIISGANFLVTYRYLSTLNNRKMRDARSFFTEGIMCSSWMMIAANPMLIIGLIMLLSDRHWQTSFFDYSGGGDTILFQHMFWFFGHPEVYIVIIPTFGFVNTLFSYYLRKRISARASLLYSIYTIAFLGFFVWGHHMYMVGLSHTTRMLFSTLTVMISVPAATKLMHWCVTLVNSSFVVELPFLFMLTYVFLFVSGGISGMCVAHTGMDILFHDTFYVIGHFHVMFAGAAMFGCFGAFYFYFSAIFGVKYSRVYAYMHFTYYLLGQLLTVIPMFWLGYAGMPRRVLDYPSAFGGWHSIITAGHMLSVAGLISFFIMIFDSLRQSKAATRTNLGIIRYNTRLNFYFYESARITFTQQKGSHLYRYFRPTAFKLNGFHYTNYEYLETTLYSYTFNKRSN